ncbi:leucyl aminopeptidase [Propionibacteriaceae bacterium Y1685]|uniref:leucyl aminopeptidase n=1 Tax=Microlunatus sp. Y1700 TaxID=3418487 RepID=UPI003B80FD05
MPAPLLPTLQASPTLGKDVDVVVVGVRGTAENPSLVGVPADLDKVTTKKVGSSLTELALAVGASAKRGRTAVLSAAGGVRVVTVGLGEDAETSPAELRFAAGVGVRAAAGLSRERTPVRVALALPVEEPEQARAVAEGALLGSYTYRPVTQSDPKPSDLSQLVLIGDTKTLSAPIAAAEVMVRAVTQAREWVNTPPNLLYPESFADDARSWMSDAKVTAEVLDEKALAKGGYGGILAVGGGSSRLPRLVRLTYSPRGAKAHLALIGKGVTFDSGGLNLKPGDSMYTMKCDMAGAATVIAATRAIADLGLKIKITCYASLAENLPSDTSYRPSDVLTMYGGTTVENGNCDAEGRLVMADALARACEDKPDAIIDVATLTGACVVALGEEIGGVMSNDEVLTEHVLAAAEAAGEDFWELPIHASVRDQLESSVADLKSTGTKRAGGAQVAAAFLREFVGENPWAHLDIAGPAFRTGGAEGDLSAGGTGVGVRTVVEVARSLAG